VWCWDITWLPGPAKGLHHYLYLILNIFSRKIVGWEIHNEESAENASISIKKTYLKESVRDSPVILHSDNGSPMKGSSMLEALYSLCVVSSFSRPRVSNDNAYAESVFKTCKCRPDYPYKGFSTVDVARDWVLKFSHWYNFNHKHSGIKYVTPHQRHSGQAGKVLASRKEVYQRAKERNPER
jgi:putative transposase